MSRIGKTPIAIPDGVDVQIVDNKVIAKGPLGVEEVQVAKELKVEKVDNTLVLSRINDDKNSRALHGLSRTLVANAVNGVKTAFVKKLEIIGVGYRANMQGKDLNLALGYSHPVIIEAPEGIKIEVEANTKITVSGTNKQKVGDVSALIRSKRAPEPYKGKGIRYEGEFVRRKAGKAGKK